MHVVLRDTLVEQLRTLGVRGGDTLLVHSSFRAVRPVDDGPAGLIDALLAAVGPAGLLAMPSWTGDDDSPFDPLRTPADAALGIVPALFWRWPGVRRGNHPMAFAAWGPQAAFVVEGAYPLPPHGPESPLGRLHALDAQVLLLGVGHDSNTAIHLAELLAGVPYRRAKHLTLQRDGRPLRVDYGENDHCCQRFALADAWLREEGLQAEGPVGHAKARLLSLRQVVRVVQEKLAADPLLFLHPAGSGCEECDDARRSLPA